ncbi:MAG: hypothetical protein Q8Q32_01165, partial [bacterium]|nr:hypothetical protein [bacterium]
AFASIKQGSLAHESQKQQAEQKSAPQTDTVQEVPELDQPENFQPIDSNKPEAKPSSKQQVQQADRPFMLHEETPKSPSNQQSISASDFSFELPGEGRPAQEPRQEKTKVSFGNFFNRVAKEKQAEQPQKVESKKEAPKVVHYSAFRTMLGDQDPKK